MRKSRSSIPSATRCTYSDAVAPQNFPLSRERSDACGGASVADNRSIRSARSAQQIDRQYGLPLVSDAPHALQISRRAFKSRIGPLLVFFGRPGKKHEDPQRVRAVNVDHLNRVDGVLLRFRHLLDAADFDRPAANLARLVFGHLFREQPLVLGASDRSLC